MNLTNIFQSKTDQRLDALREVCKLNGADEAWKSSFAKRGKEIDAAWHLAEEEMKSDPSPASCEKFLKARIKAENECSALGAIEPQIAEVCTQRLTERTRPVLKDALACLIERLETERDAVIDRDKASALAFGLEVHDTESPVLRRVSGALLEAKNWLSGVDAMTFSTMRNPIKACIGEV